MAETGETVRGKAMRAMRARSESSGGRCLGTWARQGARALGHGRVLGHLGRVKNRNQEIGCAVSLSSLYLIDFCLTSLKGVRRRERQGDKKDARMTSRRLVVGERPCCCCRSRDG